MNGTEGVGGIELTIFWMLVAVAAVALVTKRIRLPYTVALVIAGLLIAVIPGIPSVELTPALILLVFLPALVFEAAYNLNVRHLLENLRPIGLLAVPGILLMTSIVAALVHFAGGLDWAVAFLFGALMAATDPISVVAIFKELGAPARLRTILEGESLLNDGTAIVVFNLILAVILTGHFDAAANVVQFGIVVGGGVILGGVLGYAVSFLLAQVNDYLVETVLTLVLAYGTYFLAEAIHVSGVIAVVTAGLLVGSYGQRVALSPSSKIAVGLSWEFFGFVANSLIFLLVGLQIKKTHLENELLLIVIAIAAVLLGRGVVVGLVSAVLRVLHIDKPLRASWQAVLVWGGLRGALSLALALSIPANAGLPREQLLVMTFGVILFSLLGQGLTMKPLLRRLQLTGAGGDLPAYERVQARLRTTSAALATLDSQSRTGSVAPEVVSELREEYQARERLLHSELDHLNIQNTRLREQALIAEQRALLQVEKSTLRVLLSRGEISEDTLRELTAELDGRLHELDGRLGAHEDADGSGG